MYHLSKLLTPLVFLFLTIGVQAQETGRPAVEMAEQLRESGKIYVVVVVLAIIFIGIIAFLITLDRRLRKLENEQ